MTGSRNSLSQFAAESKEGEHYDIPQNVQQPQIIYVRDPRNAEKSQDAKSVLQMYLTTWIIIEFFALAFLVAYFVVPNFAYIQCSSQCAPVNPSSGSIQTRYYLQVYSGFSSNPEKCTNTPGSSFCIRWQDEVAWKRFPVASPEAMSQGFIYASGGRRRLQADNITSTPTALATSKPSPSPSPLPTAEPSPLPSASPTASPSAPPTESVANFPSSAPSRATTPPSAITTPEPTQDNSQSIILVGSITAQSRVIKVATADVDTGYFIAGTGIPTGATVVSIDSTSSLTISAPATATINGVQLLFNKPALPSLSPSLPTAPPSAPPTQPSLQQIEQQSGPYAQAYPNTLNSMSSAQILAPVGGALLVVVLGMHLYLACEPTAKAVAAAMWLYHLCTWFLFIAFVVTIVGIGQILYTAPFNPALWAAYFRQGYTLADLVAPFPPPPPTSEQQIAVAGCTVAIAYEGGVWLAISIGLMFFLFVFTLGAGCCMYSLVRTAKVDQVSASV